jgi:glycosyltransferase involved in cell wall biosynthesis
MGAVVVGVYTHHDLASWSPGGERPGAAPYGLEHLSGSDVQLLQLAPPTSAGACAARSFRRFEYRMGTPVSRAFFSQRMTKHADVALAVLEREGYAHAILRRAGLEPWSATPVALVTCWLAEDARVASGARLRRLRLIAGAADLYVFWSRNQRAILHDRLRIPKERLVFVPFGVETEFYQPASESGDYVLAVGRDRGRDYASFLSAVCGMDVAVKMVCPRTRLQGLAVPRNVEVLGEVDHLRYRRLLQRAGVVVVPSRPEVAYPTGQSVLLNAMSCRRPTVVSATEALSDYIRHGENTYTVPPLDYEALRGGIERVLSDRALADRIAGGGKADVERFYNTRAMWGEIATKIRERASQ